MNDIANTDDVIESLKLVMINKLRINPKWFRVENYNKALTGSSLGLSAITMTYLLFEVERLFKVKIMPHDIIDEKFNTINNIAEIIINKVCKEVNYEKIK